MAITVVAVSCSGNNETGPPTVVVDRGTVALAVSASGSIAPGGRQSLGFADGGTVTEVLVNVGDQVQPGQVLARIDDTVARQTLAQRQATLAQQTATLNKLIGGNTRRGGRGLAGQGPGHRAGDAPAGRRDERREPVGHLAGPDAAELRQVVAGPGRAAVRRRPVRVPGEPPHHHGDSHDAACSRRDRADHRPADRRAHDAPDGRPAAGRPAGHHRHRDRASPHDPADQPADAPSPELRRLRGSGGNGDSGGNGRVITERVGLRAASSPLDDDVDDDVALADGRTGAACSRLLSDRSAVQQAEGAVVASQTALDAAEERENTDRAAGDVSIQNAQQGVVTAQNQLGTAGNDRPQDIAAQRAQVEDARAGVVIAQRDLDETVIIAPAVGTVTAINGTAGEVVAPPSAVTALAPGGRAPLPATSGGTGTGTGGSAAPGAGAFLTLDSANSFQVVVPFEEADAARVLPGQPVQVSVDALPNDTLTGRVTSVAPSGVDLSGIVSYYATITVDGAADRLRDGQTAEADVRVEVADNVLRVPAAAVRRSGGQPTVTITGPDGTPVSMPFLAGLVGDDYVEVRSGLTDGDKVELPQATVTARPQDQGPPDN